MNKKILALMIILIAFVSLTSVSAAENDTVLSISDNNDVMSISNDNISYQSNEVIGNSLESDSLLGDSDIPTQISLERSSEGLIEDNKITITATLTDEDGNPLKTKTVQSFVDGTTLGTKTTDENGQISVDVSRTSGFYYFQVKFLGQEGYAASNSEMIELAFANNNALTDFVVRMILSDGVMNLTKDYTGYGSNKVVRRNASNYSQILNNYEKLNNGIVINKDLVINGNGHKIDLTADYSQRTLFVFNKENVRVTLNNLSVVNGYTNDWAYPIIALKKHTYLNLNYVNISDCRSASGQPIIEAQPGISSSYLYLNVKNSIFTDNNVGGIFSENIFNSNIEQNIFLNNSNIFKINQWDSINIRYNIFIGNPSLFSYQFRPVWEMGEVRGNYFGTNDTNYINNDILPNENKVSGADFYYQNRGHSYLTITGNSTFCEDDVQDYGISFTGSNADKLPVYKTIISYTSTYSTINGTDINISSTPTTFRVTPKTYGVETFVVEPNLYELNINITKSTKINYKVTVDAPQSEYLTPLVITVNVKDDDDNPVTTKANVTVDGTTHTINITDGVGTLEVNGLAIGSYDVTTKILSNMANYRNTTVYSTATVTKIRPTITLSCSNQTSIARENITFNVNVKNMYGSNVPYINVSLREDNVEIAKSSTDAEGNIVFTHAPEAGVHSYLARIVVSDYSYAQKSNTVNVDVISKIPTKLTISSDTEMITEPGQKATFNVKLVDVNNTPISGAEIKLVANDVVVDSANTNNAGECVFEYTNSSNLYEMKAVYDGNLTYYDNSSEIIELIISTGGNFFDLSILINITKDGGVLTLIHDFIFNETIDQDFVNGIPINKNITINGNNKVINALNKAKVFNIKADTVAIDNLTIVNAFSTSSGGAIYFDGDTLTISNSEFEDNEVILAIGAEPTNRVGGGAIYSNGVLNIVNSTFYNNKLFVHNDAPIEYNGGGAIYAHNNLNIYNSIFDSNKALNVKIIEEKESYSSYASSVFIGGGNTLISNSTFKNGLSDVNAIYFSNMANGNFSVYDSLFLNNTASRGGALGIGAACGEIVNTTFENNTADKISAIEIQAPDFLITESRFIGNSAELGGVISTYVGNNITVEKSYFLNNHANDTGAIFYSEEVGLTLRYNIFVNNTGQVTGVYYEYGEEYQNNGNLNYDYWGNNTPYDADVFNEYIKKGYDYITLEIIGENLTYTTIPTTYTIKFNGTNADKLPNFETLIEALAEYGVTLDKTSIVINGSGAKVVLTSDAVQNVTLVVGPEYNILALFNISVEQLIKKNYTSNITVNPTEYGSMIIATVEILDEEGNGINGSLTYTFNNKSENATIENGKAQIPLGRLDAGEYDVSFVYNSTDLFYNDLSGNKTFNISKTNMTFTLDVMNITYGEDEIITATPQRGVDGNFTFYIKDILNQTVEIEFGEAVWALNDLSAGNYTIIATYNGNGNYNPATQSKNFTISKAASKIEISIDDVNYGDDIIAVVTGVNVTGNVTVTVNNKNYTVEIVNNVGNVTIDKLNADNYAAVVRFDGNTNITGLTNETEFNVYKASTDMTVDISESIAGHDTTITVKFRDDVEGTVTITVDGTPKDVSIEDGVATLNLTDLAEGQHTVNVTYPGNSNFNSSAFNTTFSTKSLTSQINVTASDVVYGNDLVVKATVTLDATGDVEFTIGNITKTGTIKDGEATAKFEGLNASDYNITAKYLGDSTYISSTNTTAAAVLKANSTVLIDIGEIKEGENVVITFTVLGNATGNITVEITGLYSPRNRTLENGVYKWTIAPVYGNYTVKVSYNGDNNYLTSSNSTDLISKYKPNIDIEVSDAFVGDDYTVEVILNSTATGTVLIKIDDSVFNKTLTGGKASVDMKNLTAGNHSVEVIYSGDANFYNATASKSFEPKSFVSSIIVTAQNIVYGNDLVVKATVTSGATGDVEFTVNNITKKVTLKNGVAQVSFSDLNAGFYDITAKYVGDWQYASSTNTTDVKVSKANSYVLIDVGEIKEGENIVIKFNVPSKATGNVTVEIPGLYNPANKTITKGVASWTIIPLKSGEYTLNVVYNGDNNYLSSSNSTVLISKYKPALDIVISDAFVGDDYTIDVILNSTATGSVLISVDGKEYNKTLKNGKASLALKNLTAGNHSVDVIYSGDDYFYNATGSKSFEPKSFVSSINVTAQSVAYGSDLVVKATVTSGATGNVEFTLNGVTKSAALKNSVAQVSFSDLNVGSYEITAKYLGDKEYISSTNKTTASVRKASSFVLIDVSEIKDGENVVIKFTVPSKATGNITVEIPGLYTSRNRTIANGVASWTIAPLKSGSYTLNVVYNGDNNYLASSNSTVLISRYYPSLDIDVSESVVGQDATINVALPANATGSVRITVDGVKYNKTLKNGKASVVISNITKGTHNVDASYSGDKYYYSASNSTSFEPKLMNSTINVIASDINFGEDLVVRAVVNEDATGTVTITVNGEDKSVQVHQGFASATFTGLDAGNYDVKAVYSGNEVYSSSANSTEVTVSKADSTLLINVGEIKDGENVVIRFIVPSKASGVVTVEIPGLYSQRNRTITDGVASWTIAPLSAGLYEVIASYDGDKNYYGSSNSTYVDYNRVKTTLNVDAIVTKNNVRLTANLTAENGQLITAWVNVTVNGTKYRIPVYNGTGYLDLGSLEGGDYEYSALYAGTRAIINSTDEGSFTVIPVVPILDVPDVVKYYKGSERLYVYLIDNYDDPIINKTVVISINKNNYTRTTDANGTASIALNLGSGEYPATVTVDELSLQKTANVTILPTVNGTDVVKVYRNATQYYATFRDSEGNYLADGTTVRFNINGVFYERKISGNKGLAKLNLNLPQGEYILTAMNPVTGENAANNVKVISKIVENRDITKYYKNGTQYTVKIIGDDGNPVGAGVEVTFNINGVFYTRTTDASGIAKLTINLIPGDYIITAEYGGCKVSNNIKVLPVLSAKDMSKKYGTSDQFVATLLDGQGNPYAGQTVQFNINGVFYNKVTNDYGQARLNINLIAGQYIITSSYNGLNIANKVTIVP